MPVADHTGQVGYEGIRVAHVGLFGYSARADHVGVHALAAPTKAAHVGLHAMTSQGLAAHIGRCDMPTTDSGRAQQRMRFGRMREVVTTFTARPFLTWQGETVELVEASVSQDEDGLFWTVRAQIANAADYVRIARLDDIDLDLFGDEYALAVQSLGRARSSTGRGGGTVQQFTIVCRSRLWATLGDEAETVTRTWDTAVTARAAVEDLAGETVDWRIVDWQIPAGRLAAVNMAPIAVIQMIAQAAGAVVESARDGSLVVRYRYPVSIPAVDVATPDHEFLEDAGVVTLSESIDNRTEFDRVALSDRARAQGYLSAERDPDQPDEIFGGEQQRFLVFKSADVDIANVLLSAGTLIEMEDTVVSLVDEEVTFANTDEARLEKPVASGFTYTWYGAGLGTITVGDDGQRITVADAGVGVARVSYQSSAKRYAVLAPATLGGREEFPIEVVVIGDLKDEPVETGRTALRIVVQRGTGERIGDDIVEPLAGNENVLLHRGRNAIDAAAAKSLVSLQTVYETDGSGAGEVALGQLVSMDDTQLGTTWRGKVTAIEHRIGRASTLSDIRIERFL